MSDMENMVSKAFNSKLTPEYLLGLSDENLVGRATAARRRFGVCPPRYLNEIERRRIQASDMVAAYQKRRTEPELITVLNRILFRTVKNPEAVLKKIEEALLCNRLIDISRQDLRPHTTQDDLDSIINVASSLCAARRLARAQVFASRRVTRLKQAASNLSQPYQHNSSLPHHRFEQPAPHLLHRTRLAVRPQPDLFSNER